MRPAPRAWLALALLSALGRAALAEEVVLSRLPESAGSIPLSAPVPLAQFSVLALSPSLAAPSGLAPLAQPDIPLAPAAAPLLEAAAAGPALQSQAADGGAASTPAGTEGESAAAAKLFDGGVETPDSDADFKEKQRTICVASTLKFATGPRSRSVLEWRQETIDGLPAKEIDSMGQANAGVYRYTRDGRRRVLKILTQNTDEDHPEDYPAYPAKLQLRNGAVGSVFGAPHILRTGTIRTGPYEKYFIEMEEKFPGEVFRGFKDSVESPDKIAWVKSLSRPARSGEAPITRIARMLVEVMEHGVVPYDGDFLVTEDGRVSWIDSNFWAVDTDASFPIYQEKLLRELNYFFRSFALDPATGKIFTREFLTALKHSRRIPEKTKDAVMDNWVEHDSKALEAVGISGRTILRSFYNGLD